MNSCKKFGGAARRRFPAICEKLMGAHMCPPAVRGMGTADQVLFTMYQEGSTMLILLELSIDICRSN